MPYAKIDLNRSCLPETKKQPIPFGSAASFFGALPPMPERRITVYYDVIRRIVAPGAGDLRLALQTRIRQTQDSDDAHGGDAQRKGADPAGSERAELGDMAHGCHRSRN